jgi:hypothetical protein
MKSKKRFRVTATWTVPYQEKEIEEYNSSDEYERDMIELLKDNCWKYLHNLVPWGSNFTTTVTVEETKK